jgi:GcrA cell cycle regulator
MNWTDEETALLARLWGEGHSGAEIGRRLGKTRNAVLGRVHRDGLPRREEPQRAARPRKIRPAPALRPGARPGFPPPLGVPLLALEAGQCARPLWDDDAHPAVEAMTFCGRRLAKGARFSFCAGCAPRMLSAAPPGIAEAAAWTTAPWASPRSRRRAA